ncbi:MAG: hypothetical protein AB8H79_14565 [Myxococcota bacterium]
MRHLAFALPVLTACAGTIAIPDGPGADGGDVAGQPDLESKVWLDQCEDAKGCFRLTTPEGSCSGELVGDVDGTYPEVDINVKGFCDIANVEHELTFGRDVPLQTIRGNGDLYVRGEEFGFAWESGMAPARHGEFDMVVEGSDWSDGETHDTRIDVRMAW